MAASFATWSFLSRRQKRKLLQGYGAQIQVRRPARGVLEVVRLDLKSIAIGCIYKKMKRYGIE